MPYKVFPRGNQFVVHKVGEDGQPVGKPLGTHPDKGAAGKQIAALNANEKKPAKKEETTLSPGTHIVGTTVTDSEGVSVTDQTTIIVTEDEEAKELETKCYGGEMVAVYVGGPLTFADLIAEQAAREATYEMYELTDQFSRLSRNIMNSETEDKAAALSALANEYASLVSEKAKLDVEDKAQTIAKQIAGDNQPDTSKSTSTPTDQQSETTDTPGGDSEQKDSDNSRDLFIWKEGDTYRWLAAYSNNRRDSDSPPEIISSQSHKEFNEALSKGEWPMPEAWLWHVPYPVGATTWHAYDEVSGFPVAAGYFYKDMEWAAEGMIKAGWDGVSHGMPTEWIARDENDPTVIVRHRTKEISFLPTWAAANKLAFNIISKEKEMSDKEAFARKRPNFVEAFGEERGKMIEATLDDKSKQADDAGIEQKEATPAEVLPASEIVKGLTFLAEQIKTLSESVDTRLKALEETQQKEESFDLVTMLKSKSAIGKAETKMDGRSKEAKDGPEEAKAQSATQQQVGVPVGLLDGLFSLNQDWYRGGK